MSYIGDLRKHVGSSPLITVGSWLLVVNENNEVLMQLRSDYNSWDFPGGVMELGEGIEDVSKRELYEETGLILDNLEILDVFSGEKTFREYPNGDKLYVVSVLCLVRRFHGDLKINDDESKELKWFPVSEIPSNLSPVTANYIDDIRGILIGI